MWEIIRGNLALLKAAPLRTLAEFALLLPAVFLSVSITILLLGILGEFLLTLVFYGLSGLNRRIEGGFYQDWARHFMSAFELLIPFGDMALKIFLIIPYSIVAAVLLISAHKYAEKKKGCEI
jgi:hypothetical protein